MRVRTATDELIDFAGSTMTGLGAARMKQRLRVLLARRERSPANDAEAAALAFARAPSPTAAAALLVEINRQAGVYQLRPALVRSAIWAFNGCVDADDFHEMAVRVREQSRVKGRELPRRAVGSNLLLKGLEADVAVIIDADLLNTRDMHKQSSARESDPVTLRHAFFARLLRRYKSVKPRSSDSPQCASTLSCVRITRFESGDRADGTSNPSRS